MAEASRTMTQLAAKQQDLSLESSQKAEIYSKLYSYVIFNHSIV